MEKISKRGYKLNFRPNDEWRLFCYVIIGEHRNYVIDTACGLNDTIAIKDCLAKYGNNRPAIVINTHSHWDHVWGNYAFKDDLIIGHIQSVTNMRANWDADLIKNKRYLAGSAPYQEPHLAIDQPIHFVDDAITIFPSLGHTNDGLCVYDGIDKVLYVGDNIGDTPDLPLPELQCAKPVYLQAIRDMEKYDFTILASGHNLLMDKAFLEKIKALL